MTRLTAIFLFLTACCTGAWTQAVSYSGYMIQGGHIYGHTDPGAVVRFDERNIPVNARGHYFIGFGRDEMLQHTLAITSPDGRTENSNITLEPGTFNIQRLTGIAPNMVNPPEAVKARIAREIEEVFLARSEYREDDAFLQPFIWPLFGPITGVYGSQRFYNGEPKNPHFGVDVARPTGTPVYAPANGMVVLAEPDLYFSGGTVIIDHGFRLSSTLMHLSEVSVQKGQQIVQGQMIGRVGATGRVTGPHLDWRMNWQDVRIDPAYLVPDMKDICDVQNFQSRKQNVILIHGLGRTSRSMQSMQRFLQDQGYNVCRIDYPSQEYPVETLASYLSNSIARIERHNSQPIHLVTHSLGGILARYSLQYMSLPANSRIVMLSPPNHGSEIIDRFQKWKLFSRIMGPAALQLSTATDSLPNMIPGIKAEFGIITGSDSSDPWFNWLFDETTDGKVTVTSARLAGMKDFLVLPVGHTMIMNNQRVQKETLFFLRHGRFMPD
ncbi:alpha/beta fold hydrolase [Gynuella sp.]|uniref:alpha/beta fold hydrolase n=1 Tax=Gynuella sp. TaxID=2969146 RepID=UPI003D0DFCE0